MTARGSGSGSGGSGAKYISRHSAHAMKSVRYGGRSPRRSTTTRSKLLDPQAHSVGGWPSMAASILDISTVRRRRTKGVVSDYARWSFRRPCRLRRPSVCGGAWLNAALLAPLAVRDDARELAADVRPQFPQAGLELGEPVVFRGRWRHGVASYRSARGRGYPVRSCSSRRKARSIA